AWVAAGHAGPSGAARLASLRRLLGNRLAPSAAEDAASSED
ncbi:ribosome small subunit-dependent GTPase A, partial [Aquicoccus sp. SCR17]|nr:ribosome small subunit-dependent GTPase A [Carideicomes alvinocaridis]